MRKVLMQRALVALALTAAATVGLPAGSFAAQSPAGGCNDPVPERIYSDDQLVYRVAVDLTDCGWWDGSPIKLEADLERLDGTGGHGAWSGTVCSLLSIRPDNDEPATGEAARPKSGVCEVKVAIGHPRVETAYYRGEVSFPAEGGQRSLSFTALCGPLAGCLDLPVDVMTTLSPIGDLIVGDDNAF